MGADTTRTAFAPPRTDVAPRDSQQCRLLKWEPRRHASSSLIGHCSVTFSRGRCIHHIPVFRGPDGVSIGTPSVPQLDADGRIRTRDGKRVYAPVISSETREARARWQNAICTALADAGVRGGAV